MHHSKLKYLAGTGLCLVLIWIASSCMLGPNYTRSIKVEQTQFRTDSIEGESIANTGWWEFFQDTTLTHLIGTALENNRNLNIAAQRIKQAQANIDIVRADLYPRVNYAIDGSSTANSEQPGLTNDATAAANVSYVVDLWGRLRRLSEAALQEYLATEEAYRALTILIVAETANAYLVLRDLDNRLIISEKTADAWQANLEIVEARFKGGFVSEVNVNQARIQLNEAKTAIQTFTRLRNQTENAISILMGMPPQVIPRGLPLRDQLFPPEIPTGLPSELLDRRPDILATERRLNAQTQRIGAAEALKYPSLTLSVDMGAQFANPALGFAGLSGQVLGPIFNNKANQKRLEIEIARTEELLNEYENSYLNALREVEDAMIAVQTYKEEFRLRREQVNDAKEASDLSWVRYDSGLTSYLEVLDLQRSFFGAQLKASETLQLQLNAVINLYQALGGGWLSPADSVQVN